MVIGMKAYARDEKLGLGRRAKGLGWPWKRLEEQPPIVKTEGPS